jgi:hypothetical protein
MGQFSFKRRLKLLIVSISKIFRSAASLLLKAEAANLCDMECLITAHEDAVRESHVAVIGLNKLSYKTS